MSASNLIDPLEKGKIMRYCSACDNTSATYSGKFVGVPINPETRFEWLVRIGVIRRTDPLPRSKSYFICDNHFDREHDFLHKSNGGTRLRTGILPWRNLKTGSYSYHGCENPEQRLSVQPVPSPSHIPTVAIQTDDVEGSSEFDRIFIPEVHCRLCLRGVRATNHNLRRLFCEVTQQPADPEVMEQLYVTTGLMLHWNREPGALICSDCTQQAKQAYRFRLQSRSNHRTYLASLPVKKRKKLYPELVYPKGCEAREEEHTETSDIEQIEFVPMEQVHIKIEPDLPPEPMEGGVSKRQKCNPMGMANALLPIGQTEIKSEPGLMDGATGRNLVAENGKRIQIVDFQEFKNMLTKINPSAPIVTYR